MDFHGLIMRYRDWNILSGIGAILLSLGFLYLILRVTAGEFRIRKASKDVFREALGADEPGFFSNPNKMVGTINGIPCECHYIQTSDRGPSGTHFSLYFPQRKLRICVPKPFSFNMAVRFKGRLEEIEEKIGLQPAIQTSDPVLDKLYHISCNNRDFAESFLAGFRHRETIKAIFHAEALISEIRFNAHGVEVTIGEVGTKVDPELLKKIVGLLDQLTQP